MLSAICFNLDQSKLFSSGNELNTSADCTESNLIMDLHYFGTQSCQNNIEISILCCFYAPASVDWRHIVFGLFVCRSVCLSVSLSAKTFTLAISFDL